MVDNFGVDMVRAGSIDRAMGVFKKKSGPLLGLLKRRRFFVPAPERRKKREIVAKKRRRRERGGPEEGRFTALVLDEYEKNYGGGRSGGTQLPATFETTAISTTPYPRQERKATPGVKTEGVAIIQSFATTPLQVVVLKDMDKSGLGFPFGSKDEPERGIVDATLIATAVRETGEECFWVVVDKDNDGDPIYGPNPDVCLSVADDGYLGVVPVADDHHVHVYVMNPQPKDAPLSKGEEQEAVFLATAEEIEDYIREGIFLKTHAAAWVMFKKSKFWRP